MPLVDRLLENSESDRDLLKKNISAGDSPSVPRDAEFVFYAKDRKRGELVCSFIHDNSFGRAVYQEVPANREGYRHRLIVSVFMPTTEHALCAVSGLMVVLADMFDLEYDGWGCSLKNAQPGGTDNSGASPLRV